MRKILSAILVGLLAAAMLSGCAALKDMGVMPRTPAATPIPAVKPNAAQNGAPRATEDMIAAECAPADGALWANAPLPDFNTEEYASVRESGFRSVATSPLSTFSTDVDTASYGNLRRMIYEGYAPGRIPAGAVRIEEMLNYFRFDYAAPQGGERFAVTARMGGCPWNPDAKLLALGLRAADAPKAAENGSNLVFLVDVSGSMQGADKLELVKKSLTLLTDSLTENDTLSIVTYASGEAVLIDGANPARDKAALFAAVNNLEAGGSTDGVRGLAQAYEVAQRHFRRGGNNRIVLCSDGDLNVGITSESDLHDYVSDMKETGVYLSVLGFGSGNYKDTKMETLADDGNGSYYYIDSMLEAGKVLSEELTSTLYAVADDVKCQVEFNPARVAQYRLIGYENRALEDADFADDKKDAAEVGAGACVTVLYELIPASDAQTGADLKYQTGALTPAAHSGEWLTLSVRYKQPGGSQSEARTYPIGDAAFADDPNGDWFFAAAVAEFGMLLQDSEFKGDATCDSAVALLKKASLNDTYKEEFFSLVKLAQRAGLLAG